MWFFIETIGQLENEEGKIKNKSISQESRTNCKISQFASQQQNKINCKPKAWKKKNKSDVFVFFLLRRQKKIFEVTKVLIKFKRSRNKYKEYLNHTSYKTHK